MADAIFDSVLNCDATVNPSGQVADKWEFSADRKSATLHIREGITFSDGSAVDAADIQASGENFAKTNARFEGIKYEIADPQNITLTWPAAEAVMISRLCELQVVPSEAVKAGTLDKEPIGSGPYVLNAGETTRGSTYAVTKRADYWDAGTYPYENVVFKVLESETAGINALKTGQIDGVLASAATVDEVKASNLQAQKMRGATTRLVISDHKGETIPALGDVKVRQAMNMVFDRDAIAKQLYRGKADPAYQIFREGTDAHLDGLKDPYPFDVEKAKQLMQDAGYADGFELQIPTMKGQNHETLIAYISEALGKINIKVKEVPQTGPDAISNILSGTYPVPLWQLGNYGDSKQDIVDYILPTGIWNVSHQEDATIAGLWEKVLTGSEEESKQAQKDINQYVIDQAWFVPMAYPDGYYAHTGDVRIAQVSDYAQLHPLLRDFQK
ncbi:ABC transporter substrate-binding protein [Pseudarthrobacter oxydans]|uniref:ABC transporter substrate-binding protein n=1 Tax=Pseudarthrobacter oxydans TaxID=1671 RepID=UPI003D2965FD